MEYKIVRSKRKTIALQINSNMEVVVKAPFGVSDFYIDELVQKRKKWIIEKVGVVGRRKERMIFKKYEEGEEFLFLGKRYKMEIDDKQKEKVYLEKTLKVKNTLKVKDLVIKWYKKEALDYFADRVCEMARDFGYKYNKVLISNAKKRWGTCNFRNDIRINWRLIMAPSEVIDYVILHELVHTKIKNHSKKFWMAVKLAMPEYKHQEKWIKDNRFELMSLE